MKLLIPAGILKAAIVYISKDRNCLLFEDGKVIATNGYSLLVWKHGVRLSAKGEAPNFLMPFDKASIKFVKAAGKTVLAFHYDTETHVLGDGYGQSHTLNTEDVEFPNWREQVPDVQTLVPIALTMSAKTITHLAEYAKVRMGRGGLGIYGFTVLTAGIDKAFFLVPYDFDDCFIVAMPIKSIHPLDNHLELTAANIVAVLKEVT